MLSIANIVVCSHSFLLSPVPHGNHQYRNGNKIFPPFALKLNFAIRPQIEFRDSPSNCILRFALKLSFASYAHLTPVVRSGLPQIIWPKKGLTWSIYLMTGSLEKNELIYTVDTSIDFFTELKFHSIVFPVCEKLMKRSLFSPRNVLEMFFYTVKMFTVYNNVYILQ